MLSLNTVWRGVFSTPTMNLTTYSIISVHLLLLLPLPAHVRAACYFIDGSVPQDSSYVACNPEAEVSPCCASNKGSRSDICMSSGLCYAQDENYQGLIFSNGCTDKTGKSNECPHFCPDATTSWGGGSKVPIWNVLQCKPGVYCCRADKDDANCCSNTTVLLTTTIGTLLVSATNTANTTDAETVTVTSAATAGITQSGNDTAAVAACPKNNSAIIGGAVGGTLGLALLASLGALGFMTKRWEDRVSSSAAPACTNRGSYVNGPSPKSLESPQMLYTLPEELPSASTVIVHEMQS